MIINHQPIHIGYNQDLASISIKQDDLLRNVFIDGTETFRNKIEMSLIKQLISNNQHVLYLDGQNNTSHTNEIINIAKSIGREKDIRILSFMHEGESSEHTHKYNWYLPKNIPLNAASLTEFLYGITEYKFSYNPPKWKKTSLLLLSALSMALVYMRDNNEIVLDFNAIKKYIIFENIINLLNRQDFPNHIHIALQTYLKALPQFNENSPIQSDTTMDHHGYLQMILYREFSIFTDSYSYLIDTDDNPTSKNKLDELYGKDNNLIFIIKFPDFSKSHHLDCLSFFVLGLIKSSIVNKLGDSLKINNNDNTHKKPGYIFINNCPILNGFYALPPKLINWNTGFFFSYDLKLKENISDNPEVVNSLLSHINIKISDNLNSNFTLSMYHEEHILTII